MTILIKGLSRAEHTDQYFRIQKLTLDSLVQVNTIDINTFHSIEKLVR